MNNRTRNSAKNNKSKKSTGKVFFKVFLIFFAVFMIVFTPVGFGLQKLGDVRIFSGEDNLMEDMSTLVDSNSVFYEAFQNSKRVNILLLGINDGMSDTIMLGSYDLENQHVDVISVPRDTYYYRSQVSNTASYKINSIYSSEGVVAAAEAVSDTLMGVPINYYMVVEDEDVREVVDAIGGVPMDIPFHMYYNDPTDKPPLHIDIPEGQVTLTSDNVVEFLRFRKGSGGSEGYPDGDIGRVAAQQEFIKSAFKQALKNGPLKTAKVILKTVESDLTLGAATKLASKAVGLGDGDITTHMLPGSSATKNGLSFWWGDETEIEAMMMEIYSLGSEEESEEQQ